MTKEQLAQLERAVAKTIENTVNGKIRLLDSKLDTYILGDTEWKKTVQPVIDAYSTANRVGDFVQWLSKIILAVVAIFGSVFGFYLINK